jgi:glycerol kinase
VFVAHLLAIDAGTTSVRALVLDETSHVLDVSARALPQRYPRPGWVEQDLDELWDLTRQSIQEVCDRHEGPFAGIGITNQRESVAAWNRRDGRVHAPAIGWQDQRTGARCAELRALGAGGLVRRRTGLVLDPYFSATKMAWLVEHGIETRDLALGTVDAWLLWNLTGGPHGGVFATDTTNAARTSLYDLDEDDYADELLELFGVPRHALAAIRPSCGRFGSVSAAGLEALAGTPISAILGDQHAALFGQRCFEDGMVKVTYGTGAFVLSQQGAARPAEHDGLLTTMAWDLGGHGSRSYALEGSAFIAGAAIGWLQDQLGVIEDPTELEALAKGAPDAGGMSFIPGFVGLGSPWWDDSASGALLGITRGSGRAQLAQAVIDALCFEVRAITDAMGAGASPALLSLRADGGAAAMASLLERQATQSGMLVERGTNLEATATGAALMAGLAEDVFDSLDQLGTLWEAERRFEPSGDRSAADDAYRVWLQALERARSWR